MAKNNIRSVRFSDEMIEIINQQIGDNFTQKFDTSTQNNRSIFYGGALYPPEDRYDVINGDYIAQIRAHGEPSA